jgi:cell division septation protein DedD
MASDSPSIKVTASDALEFESISPRVRKGGGAIKTLMFVFISVILGAGSWAFYGDSIISIISHSEGEISIVRADISPVKVRPEKPGGLQVPDRDKLVYSRIQNGGSESKDQATVERLLPLPETPLTRPSSVPIDSAQFSVKAQPLAETPNVADLVVAVKPTQAPPPPVPTSTPRMTAKTPKPVLLFKSKVPIIVPKTAASKPAITVEPVPKPDTITKATQNRKPTITSKSNPKTDPSNNVYRVQLAAARNLNAARKEWDRLRLKNLDVLGNLGSKITKYDSGANGVFYRLRAGPLKKDVDARALCKTLAKRKTGCLVIRPGK